MLLSALGLSACNSSSSTSVLDAEVSGPEIANVESGTQDEAQGLSEFSVQPGSGTPQSGTPLQVAKSHSLVPEGASPEKSISTAEGMAADSAADQAGKEQAGKDRDRDGTSTASGGTTPGKSNLKIVVQDRSEAVSSKEFDSSEIGAEADSVEALFEEAHAEGRKLVEDYPNAADAYEVLARLLWLSGRYTEAGDAWSEGLKQNPNYAYAHHGLGQVAGKMGDFEEAAARHQRAVALMPNYVDAIYHAAGALTQLGKTEDATRMLSELAEAQQTHATWTRLGQTYVAARDYGNALNAFARALGFPTAQELDSQDLSKMELHQDQLQAMIGLATVLARLNRPEKAEQVRQYLVEAARHERSKVRSRRAKQDDLRRYSREIAAQYVQIGRFRLAAKDFELAESVFKRASQLDPADSRSRVQLVSLYMGLMQAEPAARVCSELVEIDPANARHHVNYGMMLMRLNRADKATVSFARAVEISPEAPAYAMLAEAHVASGNLPAALRAIGQAIECEPENPQWQALKKQLDSKTQNLVP